MSLEKILSKIPKIGVAALSFVLLFQTPTLIPQNIKPLHAQERKQGQTKGVIVDGKIFTVDDAVLDYRGEVVRDKRLIEKVVTTKTTLEETLDFIEKAPDLNIVSWLAKGQELTMKHTRHIEWTLGLPARLLTYVLSGATDFAELATKELTKKELLDAVGDISKNQRYHFTGIAYEHYRKARQRFNEAKNIIDSVKRTGTISFTMAERLRENSEYVAVYSKPTLEFYKAVLEQEPLHSQWIEDFVFPAKQAIISAAQVDERLVKRLLGMIERTVDYYPPHQQFKLDIVERKNKAGLGRERFKDKTDKIVERMLAFTTPERAYKSFLDGLCSSDAELYYKSHSVLALARSASDKGEMISLEQLKKGFSDLSDLFRRDEKKKAWFREFCREAGVDVRVVQEGDLIAVLKGRTDLSEIVPRGERIEKIIEYPVMIKEKPGIWKFNNLEYSKEPKVDIGQATALALETIRKRFPELRYLYETLPNHPRYRESRVDLNQYLSSLVENTRERWRKSHEEAERDAAKVREEAERIKERWRGLSKKRE